MVLLALTDVHPQALIVFRALTLFYLMNTVPSFGDVDSLPQVHAFFLESFRWRPGTGGGIQRRATEDIIYVRHMSFE